MSTPAKSSLRGFKLPSGYTVNDVRRALSGGSKVVYFTYRMQRPDAPLGVNCDLDGHATSRGRAVKMTTYGAVLGQALSGPLAGGFYPIIDARIEGF